MADVGAQVFGYFRQRGYSPPAAAGFVGNFQQESSLNPNESGGGLDQGQGSRYHPGNLTQQLNGIEAELNGSERGTREALRAVKTPEEAARIISQKFERPSEPMLSNRERYAREALQRYAGQALAAPGAPTPQSATAAVSTAVSAPSEAETAALGELLTNVKALTAKPTPVAASASPARPAAFAAPTLPSGAATPPGITPKSASASSASQLLPLVEAAITAAAPTSSTTTEAAPHTQVAAEHPGSYVDPVPGFVKGRTDQGVDYSAKPGAPILAIGRGRVLPTTTNWFKGQPYVSYELLNGPQKGKVVYVAEEITPQVHAGQEVRAGQRIGVYAPSGTGIEIGLGTHAPGQTLAKATTGYTEGEATKAGQQFRAFLETLERG